MYSDLCNFEKKKPEDKIKPVNHKAKYSQNYNDSRYYQYDEEKPEIIDIREAKVIKFKTVDNVEQKLTYLPNYLEENEAKDLYDHLVKNIKWTQREGVNLNGDKYFEPRQTSWFGKPYKYSSVAWDGNEEWEDKLKELRIRLTKDHPISEKKEYNSVMCNYYRDNKDSIGWHADDETSLGRFPKIASISLGCERVFEVCKRNEYYNRYYNSNSGNPVFNGCSILYRFHLNPGSLLLMEGAIQEWFLHRVPKENDKMDGRINLTYRYIVSEEEENAEIERRKEQKEKRKRNSHNKYPNESAKGATNNPDEIHRVNKERKISGKTDKGEISRGYPQNRNRSNNNYHNNKPTHPEHSEVENNSNNNSAQHSHDNYQRKTPYNPGESKSENKNACTDEDAKIDYKRFMKKKGI